MTPDIPFALWLLRKARGLTQRELAQKSKATREQVSDWEVGTKSPTIKSFLHICNGLNVSPGACLRIAEARNSGLVLLKKPAQRVEEWRRAA